MVKSHLAGLVVAALVAGGGAAAWAADGSSSTASPTTPTSTPAPNGAKPGAGHRAGPAANLARRAIHGDLIVRGKDGQFQNVTLDRGTIDTKGDNSFTIKRADGQTVTVKVDANTKYRGVSGFDALQTGKPAGALTQGGVAKMVVQPAGQRNPNAGNVGT